MQNTAFLSFRLLLLTGALALGMSYGSASLATPAFAQAIPGDPDHLKCYRVLKDGNPADWKEVDLYNKFGLEPGCDLLTKAPLFCTPTAKFVMGEEGNGDDPVGKALLTDFLCYDVQCPPNPNRRVAVDDQFGARDIGIRDARMVCTPTLSEPPQH
jgi:hypothetical protein